MTVHTPEVLESDARLPPDLVALRRFARLMDEEFVIPGTNRRFGIDAVLGLIPGIGDVVGGVMSAWIVVGAFRHRVPFRIIVRMMANIGVDLFVGSVPVAGDVFDFLFDENMKNMRLLEAHRDKRRPPRPPGSMLVFAAALMGVVILIAIGLAVAMILAAAWLFRKVPWF